MNNFRLRPQLQQVINQSSASAYRRREQLVQIGVKLRELIEIHAEQAEMSADAFQRTELTTRISRCSTSQSLGGKNMS